MRVNRCRVCDNFFFKKPLLIYENMPAVAQNLPNKNELKKDRGIDLKVCQCTCCGLVQLSNNPVPYYREVIRASKFSEEMQAFRAKQFKEFVRKYSLKNKKIIEIGCGKGEYLSLMKKTGAKSYGLESLKESVEQCIKNGLRVSRGFIEDEKNLLENSPFDAFYILNYLEHLPSPNKTLKGVWNNLKEEGIGIVEVPNFDMILRKNLFSEFTADHLCYFTKETLKNTLIKNNFEIIECSEIWNDYILSATVKKSKKLEGRLSNKKITKLDLSQFCKHRLKLEKDINTYLDRFSNKNVAIWGAGHQSLAIISLMNLKKKIKYVIDSATFKQGRYTPSTHLPIVHPDELEKNPIDSIIIIAGSYSDEVARMIKQKHDLRLEVSILRDYGLEKA